MTKTQLVGKYAGNVLVGILAFSFLFLSKPGHADETAGGDTTSSLTSLSFASGRASEPAMQAIALLGVPYKMGGTSPENGLDCSGLVRYVFKQAWDTALPRTSEEMSQIGQPVDRENLQPGDLVFFDTLRRDFSHVGIYLGEKRFIHSPSSGGQVRMEDMDMDYWKNRFNGARRIAEPAKN